MSSVNQCVGYCFATSATKSLNGVVPCIERHQSPAKYPGKEVGWTLFAFLMIFKHARLLALSVICVLAPLTGFAKFCWWFTVLCTYFVQQFHSVTPYLLSLSHTSTHQSKTTQLTYRPNTTHCAYTSGWLDLWSRTTSNKAAFKCTPTVHLRHISGPASNQHQACI